MLEPPTEARARPRILLVDDYEPNLVALGANLASNDWELVTAQSGEQALRHVLLDERPFSLIILDVAMPGISGFEVAELLQQRERTRHIPILFVTSQVADEQSVFRGYSVGAVDYLTRPVDGRILRAKARLLVEMHEYARALRDEVERLRNSGARTTSTEAAAIARRPVRTQLPKELPALLFRMSPGGTLMEVAGTLVRYEGFTTGAQLPAIGHPDDGPTIERALQTADASHSFELEVRFRDRRSREWRWLMLRCCAEVGPKSEVLQWWALAVDIHAHKRALDENTQLLIREQAARQTSMALLRRAELQADAAEITASWEQPEALLSRLAHLLIGRVADWCVIDLVRSDGVDRVAVIHRDRTWSSTAAQLEQARSSSELEGTAIARVLRSGRSELHAGRAVKLAEHLGADAETVGRLGSRGWAIVPFAAGDAMLGTLTVVTAAGRDPLLEPDVQVLECIARRAAMSISALHRSEGEARTLRERDEAMGALAAELAQRAANSPGGSALESLARVIEALARGEFVEPEAPRFVQSPAVD